MEKTKVIKDLENATLTTERTFAAPIEKVWRAFSDKDWFVQWWGPEGWETSVKEFDFVPGGRNHYCMKCVDNAQGEFYGQESWGLMEYQSIDEPGSFVYNDYFSDEAGAIQEGMPGLKIKNELISDGESTTLRSIVHGDSAEDIEKLIGMGMIEGFASSADKLERLVEA